MCQNILKNVRSRGNHTVRRRHVGEGSERTGHEKSVFSAEGQ